MSQPIWYTIDCLGTRKNRELVRASRSRVLLSLFTSPQALHEPSNHRGGGSGILLTPNTWFFHQSSKPQPRGRALSIDFWYHICGVSANATGWVINTVLTSDASHVVLPYYASDKETEICTSHDPNSMLKNSIEPETKLRNSLTCHPHFKVQDKIRNSEMEEIFRARKEWRWVGLPCHVELSTLTSGPFALPSQALWTIIYGLLLSIHSVGICIELSTSGD